MGIFIDNVRNNYIIFNDNHPGAGIFSSWIAERVGNGNNRILWRKLSNQLCFNRFMFDNIISLYFVKIIFLIRVLSGVSSL